MNYFILILVFISALTTRRVNSCPALLDVICPTYEEFLTLNNETVAPGTDKILQDLDKEHAKCGPYGIDIRELTIAKAQEYFQSGQLSSAQLTACYLNRIRHMNLYLNAVIEINPDAEAIATKMDLARKSMSTAGGLHGIPIIIKDNIATLDSIQTTAGALALDGLKPNEDSDVVKLIRESGAVILGKANMGEWAAFRGFGIPFSWSGRGGQGISPYVLTSDPTGSSTGSAIAVAANLALVAIGTETDQSIILPSNVASLVGLKTTAGKISTKGVIPLSVSQDVVGPITRTVADASIVFRAISPADENIRKLAIEPLQAFRVGVARSPFWNESDIIISKSIRILESALKNLGNRSEITIIDPVRGDKGIFESVSGESEYITFLHEFKYYVNQYLNHSVNHRGIGGPIASLADLINFNIENPSPEGYNQITLIEANATDGVLNSTYLRMRDQNIENAREYLDSILVRNDLDAMVVPCQSEKVVLFISFGAISGYPYITVPVGINEDGIPVGICFLGRPNTESILLNISSIMEEVHPGRQVPSFSFHPWN